MLENSECREIKNSVTSSESVKNHIAGKLLIKAQSKVQGADKGRWTGLAVINPLVDDYAKITKPKYLLICKACLWCASFINGQLASTKCPLCHNGEVDCIPIAEDENCLFDYSHSRGIELKFTNNIRC
jgi:hypothetical protein